MTDEWVKTTLGEIAEVSRNRTDPRLLGDQPLVHYSIPVLDETGLPAVEVAVNIASHKFTVTRDAVLVSLLNPRIPRVWKAIGAPNAVCSTEFAVLTPVAAGLETDYLHLLCQSEAFWEELQKRAVGTTGSRQRAKAEGLLSIVVAIPPLPVQRRIVDLMAHLDNHLANLRAERQAHRRTETVLRVFLLAAGEGDEVVSLGEVADWYSGGTPKAGEPVFYENGTIPWAVIADVNDGPVRSTAKCVTEAGLAKIGHLAPTGAVLVTMYGTIGRVGIAEVELATNQAIAWGVAKDGTLPKFLFHCLLHLAPHLDSLGRGATQRNINREILRQQVIPKMSVDRQREIAQTLDAFADLSSALDREIDAVIETRRALLTGLLSGQLEIDSCYDQLLSEVA